MLGCPHSVCKGEGHVQFGLEIGQVVTTHLSLVSNIFMINSLFYPPLHQWKVVGLWMVKTMHGKVRYGGVELLIVYLFWCWVSLWLSSKLSSSDLSNTVQKSRCRCMYYLHVQLWGKQCKKCMLTGCCLFPHPPFSAFQFQLHCMHFALPNPQLFLPSSKIFLTSFQLSFPHSHLHLSCRNHYLPFP